MWLKSLPNSYLPFLSKVFENHVHSRLCSFFDIFENFHREKYGFKKNKSTTETFFRFTDEIYETFNKRKQLI